MAPPMQDCHDIRLHLPLLVAVCRRDAHRQLDPVLVESLAGGRFRRAFFDLASSHRVLGLALSVISRGLASCERAVPVRRELDFLLRPARRRAAIFEMQRDRVVDALGSVGSRTVLLKGAALAITHYNEPFERDVADLDILVGEDQLDRSLRALEAKGYVRPRLHEDSRGYRDFHFHMPLSSSGAYVVEVHWGLTRKSALFRLNATEFIRAARRLERPGQPTLLVPRAEHTLLHLVIQNLQEGFSRLARLVDMDRIVTSTPGLDWSVLVSTAHEGNLATATAVSLQLAHRILGTHVPQGAMRELRPGRVTCVHLTIMRPVRSVLSQRLEHGEAFKRLHELWLLTGVWQRVLLFRRMLVTDDAVSFPLTEKRGALRRLLSLGKLFVLQAYLYLAALVALFRPSGRAQMRFWRCRIEGERPVVRRWDCT